MTARSPAERSRAYRDRLRGGPAPQPELRPCGTYAAARRHQRRGEDLCDACAEALAAEQARQYQRRRQR